MQKAIAKPFQVEVPGVLEGHAGNAKGLFVLREKRIQACCINATQ